MKNKIFTFLRVGVSLGLLGLLFWLMRHELKQIWGTLTASNFWYILAAIGLFVVLNVPLISYRMKLIFEGENLKLSLWESIQLAYIGYFFNNFMPTAVGGDIIKAHYATQTNQQRMRSYASVMMDRIIGLYSLLIIAGVALIMNWERFEMPLIRIAVFVFLVLGGLLFVVILNKRVTDAAQRFFRRIKMMKLGERLESLYGIVHDYRNRLDIIVKALLMSLAAQSMYFLSMYFFFLSLGRDIGVGNVYLIMPIVIFISMFPSLGGLGVREGGMVALFGPLAGKDNAFAASLLLLFMLFFVSLIGGIVYLWWGVSVGKEKKTR